MTTNRVIGVLAYSLNIGLLLLALKGIQWPLLVLASFTLYEMARFLRDNQSDACEDGQIVRHIALSIKPGKLVKLREALEPEVMLRLCVRMETILKEHRR